MKQLRYISVQPATDYYAWQVEVMINNFVKRNVHPNYVDVIGVLQNTKEIPKNWTKLAETYNYIRFFFYEDTRQSKTYISSVRPHILEKHFIAHPYLKDDAIFYHDCDMIFLKNPNWDKFVNDDTWYLSDTRFYISAQYIQSKKYGIYEKMCEIIGINPQIPIDNELNSGGAQYIMKNVDASYWKKVYDDSETLYKFFIEHLKEHPETPEYHPIQKWTADMWAVLWNAWYFKHEVKVVPEMEFVWPIHLVNEPIADNVIFHNAGVTHHQQKDMFLKSLYINRLPYDIRAEDYSMNYCSQRYINEIIETSHKSCLYD